MKVFVIGATGNIGSHVAARLIAAGHEVVGSARNDVGAATVARLGASVWAGDVNDHASMVEQAMLADATVFAPQVSQHDEFAAVDALLRGLKGSGKTFVFTSGTGVLGQRTMGDWSEDSFAEDDEFVPSKYLLQRRQTEVRTRVAAQEGVRAMVIRPPVIWGGGYFSFVERLLESIEQTGRACYIGRGLNIYTHVHVEDLAELYRLVLEKGLAGALYHAPAGELNNRTLAEHVARRARVETQSVTPTQAMAIWDKFTVLIVLGVSSRTRGPRSRGELGWTPTRVDLAQAILDGELDGRSGRSRATLTAVASADPTT